MANSLDLPLPRDKWNAIAKDLHLSRQQKRIVEFILVNYRDKQISQAMGLRLPTVRTYLSRIFLRVGVGDRHELVLRLLRLATGVGAETTHN